MIFFLKKSFFPCHSKQVHRTYKHNNFTHLGIAKACPLVAYTICRLPVSVRSFHFSNTLSLHAGSGAYQIFEILKIASLAMSLALPANIRLGWKGMPQLFINFHWNSIKSFITLGPALEKVNVKRSALVPSNWELYKIWFSYTSLNRLFIFSKGFLIKNLPLFKKFVKIYLFIGKEIHYEVSFTYSQPPEVLLRVSNV